MVPNSSTILRTFARQLPGGPGRAPDCRVDDAFDRLEQVLLDKAVREILILAPRTILVRRHDEWSEAAGFTFRDAEQLRQVLARTAEAGRPVVPDVSAETVRDVRLPNGFYMTAVVPPEILDASPTAVFVSG